MQQTPAPATGSATSIVDGRSQNKIYKPFNLRVSFIVFTVVKQKFWLLKLVLPIESNPIL